MLALIVNCLLYANENENSAEAYNDDFQRRWSDLHNSFCGFREYIAYILFSIAIRIVERREIVLQNFACFIVHAFFCVCSFSDVNSVVTMLALKKDNNNVALIRDCLLYTS